jgi:monothiol glutaredoxin
MAQEPSEQAKQEALLAAIRALEGGVPLESPNATEERIQALINDNKVVLFMKGTKFFPQCGFSDTATKILEALKVDYEAVDVLADNSIRQGIKEFSQWPTIPQLYINQEFIGGSDILINMYESGELQEILKEES